MKLTRLLAGTLLVLTGACGAGTPRASATAAAPATAVTSSPTPGAPASTTTNTSQPAATALPLTPRIPVQPPLIWTACKGGFQCSSMSVPLDYAAPSQGTVRLRLVRMRASGPGARIGSLLVNPGGPGVSAIDYLRGFAPGATAAKLRRRFDLVAFDPRGTTGSVPVHCLNTSELDRFFHVDPAPDSPQEIASLDNQSKLLAAGCERRSGRILAHLSTVDAARDMESVRAVLRQGKLTYLGFSYGTALGAAYLDEFPTHVRAMVLDGALDPRSTWDELAVGQAKGFDLELRSFLAWCNRNPAKCAFRKTVSGDLTTAYDRIAAALEKHAVPGIGRRVVGPAELSFGAGQALYSTDLWPALGAALSDLSHRDGNIMLQLNDFYLERTDRGYNNTIEANYAVNCVDRPYPKDNAAYQRVADSLSSSAPRLGPGIAWGSQACARWPVPATGRPHAVSGKGSPPIVVIGTTRDPATPYVWAVGLAKQLDHGILLTYNGDGHTAFGRSNACIADPVNAYLLTARAPAARTC